MSALERFAAMNAPCPCKAKSGPVATKAEWMEALRAVIIEMLDEVDDAHAAREMDRIRRDLGQEPHG